jgi:predicted DNA-binding transcriptional regulator AlpA
MSRNNPSPHAVPEALAHFNNLPDIAQVDAAVVIRLYGCSMATLWRRVNQKLIPQPRKFGRSTRWNVGQLRRHLENATDKVAA